MEIDALAVRRALNEAKAQLRLIWELHTDSIAGVCPTCYRVSAVSDTDDGLVDWPCPTILAIDPDADKKYEPIPYMGVRGG